MSEPVQRAPFIEGALDAHGNAAESWGAAVALVGAYGFDPGSTSEPRLGGHDRVLVEPTLYGPYDMPFLPRDRAIVRGRIYEVEGEVRQWKHQRTNRNAGAVVTLRRVDG